MSASVGALLAGASFITMALSVMSESVLLLQAFTACFVCGLLFAVASVITSGIASRKIAQRGIHFAALVLGVCTLFAYLFVLTTPLR